MIRIPLLLVLALQALPGQTPDTTAGEAADTPSVQVGPDRATLDSDAQETLQALLERMQGLEDVRVEVEAGLARLTGEVPSGEARDRATDVARRVEGVSFVDNRLSISSSPAEQLDPAMERLGRRLGDLVALLPALGVALLAMLLSLLLARWIGRLDLLYQPFTDNPFVANVLRQLARGGLLLAGVLVAVEVLDVTALVGAVIGTAGVAGLALGFAFKEIVENYLAGLLLSLRHPFAPNDTVALEGITGKVIRLTSRETILMDLDGNHVRIPNATVFRSVMTNYTRNPRRRFEVRVAVAPNEDLSRAMAVGRDALRPMKGILEQPAPSAAVEDVGESSVTVVWYGWIDQASTDFLKARSEGIRRVLEALDAAGVDMPPPERRVRLVSEEGAPLRPPPSEAAGAGTGDTPRRPRETAGEPEDVSVDHSLDEQIEEDRRTSGEEDLLTPSDDRPDRA